MLSIFVAASAFLDNWNTDAGRQFSHGRWKIDVFVLHHESKNTSPDAASKTVKRLTLRADMERRSLFLMKWAERFEIRAGPFQWKISPDHFDDVVRGRDLLYGF